MTTHPRRNQVEARFRELLAEAELPAPDEVARLTRALIFLWYSTKAIILLDLQELPSDGDPLDGFDADRLREDILGLPLPLPLPFEPGFAETG